jgi:hypothetical protein
VCIDDRNNSRISVVCWTEEQNNTQTTRLLSVVANAARCARDIYCENNLTENVFSVVPYGYIYIYIVTDYFGKLLKN